jgi:2-polyprenyl-6-methoxyphenol hydroxylase-like FAD-dependent oxidoreductase
VAADVSTGPDVCTDVLVVGGGLTGLTAAGLLALNGCDVLLVERHRSTSTHPKARLANVRSMEIYRALGVERQVLDAGEPVGAFVLAEDLAGEHRPWIGEESVEPGVLSPCRPRACDQRRIEAVLRRRAVELGADLRFATELAGLDVTADGVRALLSDSATVDARWAVAADGAHSPVREHLGVRRHGEPVPGTAISALFRADLTPALRGRRVTALLATAAGAFLFSRGTDDDRSWQLGTHLRPDWDPADLTGPLVTTIRAATGLPDLDPVVEDVLTWTTGAYVADDLRVGPVFLAGDAAHVMPPYGGFGGNAGVADAHNLAWKLAAVCRGDAPGTLLDTYTAERGRAAELTVAQAMIRAGRVPGAPPPDGYLDLNRIVLGVRYDGAAPEDPAEPSGDPGTRAAHVALADGRSTLDLVDPTRPTVIGGRDATPLTGAVLRTVEEADITEAHRGRWQRVYGGAGALVRPDGVVADRGVAF